MLSIFLRWFLKFQHVDPSEAVQIHEDVKSMVSLGIHWGTFPLGYEVCMQHLNYMYFWINNTTSNDDDNHHDCDHRYIVITLIISVIIIINAIIIIYVIITIIVIILLSSSWPSISSSSLWSLSLWSSSMSSSVSSSSTTTTITIMKKGIYMSIFFFQHYMDPPHDLKEALQDRQIDTSTFIVLNHGESMIVPPPRETVLWWASCGYGSDLIPKLFQ